MKQQTCISFICIALALGSGLQTSAVAQGVSSPLSIYGMDRFVSPDVRTRGMGWAGTAAAERAGALYSNPALLTTVNSLEVRVGGSYRGLSYDQRQEWYPDKPYATLSLLFEDKLDGILDTNSFQPKPLERPYDDLGPNWEKTSSATRPASIVAAIPIDFGSIKLVAAAGYGEAINLDHYFQNNNALSPNIGSFQPAPIPRPVLGETVMVAWYQHFVERSGSVFGFTPGFGIGIGDNINLGFSATILSGSTDDKEGRVERGLLRLTTSATGGFNVYTIDSIYYRVTSTGSSTYKGVLPTIGAAYRNENISFGLSYRLPGTITRTWDVRTVIDTTGAGSDVSRSGEDKVEMPANLSIGMAFFPHERWKIGVDYVINNYSDAVYTPEGDSARNPWLTSKYFRLGAEVRIMDGLYLRGGYREDALAYSAVGAPIAGDPIKGSSYSLGIGLQVAMVMLDVAYEYNTMQYRDSWTSNINHNRRTGNALSAELSVAL